MIFKGAFGGGLSERKKIQSGVWCTCHQGTSVQCPLQLLRMLHITSAQYRDIIPLLTAAAVSLSSDKNHKNLNILIGNLGFNSVKNQKESFLNVMCIQNLLTISWWVGRTLSEKCSRGLYF